MSARVRADLHARGFQPDTGDVAKHGGDPDVHLSGGRVRVGAVSAVTLLGTVGMFGLGILLIGELSAAKWQASRRPARGPVKPADAPVTRAACVHQDLDIRDRTHEKGQ